MKLGIIPAGGNSTRFRGCPKELLPIGKNKLMIDRAVDTLKKGGADTIMVYTNDKKINLHKSVLGNGVDYVMQDIPGMWGAMLNAFNYNANQYMLVMPDTYVPLDIFKDELTDDFCICYFKTKIDQRFGYIVDGEIQDKVKLPNGEYRAWGALAWTKKVVDFWLEHLTEITNHTDAINLAMKKFGFLKREMKFYYDLADWDDYSLLVLDVLNI